VLICTTCR